MTKSISNPYRNLSRASLYAAAQLRAGELIRPVTRTPEERAALAVNTAHLLLAMAMHVDTKEFASESPQKSIREGMPLADAFENYHDKLAGSARYAVFVQAGDVALGNEHQRSAADADEVRAMYSAAVKSDDGLKSALARLQEMHEHIRNQRARISD